jgi:hypothetical protein
MPISSPSAFLPPKAGDTIDSINSGIQTGARCFFAGYLTGSKSTVSDLIVIGDTAVSVGLADANSEYSVVIGSKSAVDYTDATGLDVQLYSGPLVLVGGNSCPSNANLLPSSVLVGVGIMAVATQSAPSTTSAGANVFIGNSILGTLQGQATGVFQLSENTFIGDQIAINCANATSLYQNTVVGARACTALSNDNSGSCNNNTIIGADAYKGLSGGNATFNTVLGAQAGATFANGRGNICIGFQAGLSGASSATTSHACYIESEYTTGQPSGCLYADMAAGNVLLGNSVTTNNGARSFGNGTATNIVKLINGTKDTSGAGGTGGGYFYCTGTGQLHWVNSTGGDTYIAG